MKILVIDVGGNHVKILATGQSEPRKVDSGPDMTAEAMVKGVKELAEGCDLDSASDRFSWGGPPGSADLRAEESGRRGGLASTTKRRSAIPVKIVNDAAMQALGSYEGGRLLFLGLGTGLGSAMVVDGVVEPLELAHLPLCQGHVRGLRRRARAETPRQEALAEAGRGRGRDSGQGHRTDRRGDRWWQRQEAQGTLPPNTPASGSNDNAFTGRLPPLDRRERRSRPSRIRPTVTGKAPVALRTRFRTADPIPANRNADQD